MKVFLIAFLFAISAWPQDQNKSDFKYKIDQSHEAISDSIKFLPKKLDSFFGVDDPNITNRSQLVFTLSFRKSESENLQVDPNINFRIHLPRTQKRLIFKFERKQKSPVFEETPVSSTGPVGTSQESSTRAFLRTLITKTLDWEVHFDTGLKIQIPSEILKGKSSDRSILEPFAALTTERTIKIEKFELKPSQEFFWYLDDGFGSQTSFNITRPITKDLSFRFVNVATWRDAHDTFYTTNGPGLYQRLSDRRGVSYHFYALGSSRPKYLINAYELSSTYRQRLHKEWFFYELTPKISFLREKDWGRSHSILLNFQTIFGN